jgi:hypothetical protein
VDYTGNPYLEEGSVQFKILVKLACFVKKYFFSVLKVASLDYLIQGGQ